MLGAPGLVVEVDAAVVVDRGRAVDRVGCLTVVVVAMVPGGSDVVVMSKVVVVEGSAVWWVDDEHAPINRHASAIVVVRAEPRRSEPRRRLRMSAPTLDVGTSNANPRAGRSWSGAPSGTWQLAVDGRSRERFPG